MFVNISKDCLLACKPASSISPGILLSSASDCTLELCSGSSLKTLSLGAAGEDPHSAGQPRAKADPMWANVQADAVGQSISGLSDSIDMVPATPTTMSHASAMPLSEGMREHIQVSSILQLCCMQMHFVKSGCCHVCCMSPLTTSTASKHLHGNGNVCLLIALCCRICSMPPDAGCPCDAHDAAAALTRSG